MRAYDPGDAFRDFGYLLGNTKAIVSPSSCSGSRPRTAAAAMRTL